MLDPLHENSSPDIAWSTVNIGEAVPGVQTPLGWTFWFEGLEVQVRGAYEDIGILNSSEVRILPTTDERMLAVFYGRAAINIDVMRMIVDRIPGTSADAMELQYFGAVREGDKGPPQRKRYASVARRMPIVVLRLPRRMRLMAPVVHAWWRRMVEPTDDAAVARWRFDRARWAFAQTMRRQCLAGLSGQLAYEQLRKLCESAGRPGLEGRLMTGWGSLEESAELALLWDVSRGRKTLDEFIERYGFHGPAEGDISSLSWREDHTPLEPIVSSYRAMDETESPEAVLRRRVAAREDAERELLSALPPLRRPSARLALGMARTHVPLRELGKALFLRAIDVARASARTVGAQLASAGTIEEPEDVFYLTVDELLGKPPTDARDAVAFRRARYDEHLRHRLPEAWTGTPVPLLAEGAASRDGSVGGIGVSPGVVSGRARIVLDPARADGLERGDILVCETTDPSWASLFLVASGLVIDVGGPLSHGAIVARELGLPCVVNTRDGTRRLRTGDSIRVDGSTGTVEVLAPASATD
jgi:phosphohistidine swiveling domain-containing protein